MKNKMKTIIKRITAVSCMLILVISAFLAAGHFELESVEAADTRYTDRLSNHANDKFHVSNGSTSYLESILYAGESVGKIESFVWCADANTVFEAGMKSKTGLDALGLSGDQIDHLALYSKAIYDHPLMKDGNYNLGGYLPYFMIQCEIWNVMNNENEAGWGNWYITDSRVNQDVVIQVLADVRVTVSELQSSGWAGFGYALVGNGQNTIALSTIQQTGTLQIGKEILHEEMIAGNKLYGNVQDAVFTLYRKSDHRPAATLTIGADGLSNKVTGLVEGEYYLRETTFPAGMSAVGTGENPDDPEDKNYYKVDIKAGEDHTWYAAHRIINIFKNDPAGMLVGKIDKDTNKNRPQGSASLKGAQFTIKYYDGYYDTDPAAQGIKALRTWVFETDEKGESHLSRINQKVSGDPLYQDSIGNNCLPLGTLTIQETKAPEGYRIGDANVHVRKITESGMGEHVQTYDHPIFKEPVIRGGLYLEKWDFERDAKIPQGEATLGGAVFEIVNKSAGTVYVENKEYAKGEIVGTITTNEKGEAKTSDQYLPYGDYEVREKTPPKGYTAKGAKSRTFSIRTDKKMESLDDTKSAIKNEIIRGDVEIYKFDAETETNEPQGSAILQGAVFKIFNRSKHSVLVGDTEFKPDEAVAALVTDEEGKASTKGKSLPYGKYEVEEITPPKGYTRSGILKRTFEIKEDSEIVVLKEPDTAIQNEPIRGDLKLVKIEDSSGRRMADIPFSITSTTTGETHVIITDKNGQASTEASWNPHTQNTNQGKTSEDGIWFGDSDAVNDEKGALLYDTYLINELPCADNEGKELLTGIEVTIEKNIRVIDLGTLTNDEIPVPELSTTAKDTETKSQTTYAREDMRIVDTVSYKNLKPGETYTIKGMLMDKETGEPLLIDKKEITAEKTFTAKKADGSEDLEFVFDGSSLKGTELVVFENLVYQDRIIATHSDLNDTGQTITAADPIIGTKARDKESGTQEVIAGEQVTIIDTVTYKDLIPGLTYQVEGILMDKETEKPLLVDEKPVTAKTDFISNYSNGTIELEFTFDGSKLGGKDVVVFEKMFWSNIEIAMHEDIEDEGQTVKIKEPKEPEEEPEKPQEPPTEKVPGKETPKTTAVTAPPVKTGDQSKIAAFVSAMLIAALIAVFIAARKKKKK